MRGISRQARLRALCVVLAVGAASLLPMTGASASATPVPMRYACALKATGLMRYVTAVAQCTTQETAVRIDPGPVFVCVHRNKTANLVAALSDCIPPTGVRALTLPSSSQRFYFCAANGSGVLTSVPRPARCTSSPLPP